MSALGGSGHASPKEVVRFCAGFRICAGFRTPAMTNYRYAPAAGVRKAPKDETAVRGAPGVPRALWGIERDTKIRSEAIFNGCQPRSRAQLGRYGTNIAKWVFELSPLV